MNLHCVGRLKQRTWRRIGHSVDKRAWLNTSLSGSSNFRLFLAGAQWIFLCVRLAVSRCLGLSRVSVVIIGNPNDDREYHR